MRDDLAHQKRAREAEKERDDLRAAVAALADKWDGGEDVGVEHVAACQDFACKTCVVIACASDLRGILDNPGAILAQRDAKVWDEGYEAGVEVGESGYVAGTDRKLAVRRNPYRDSRAES
jgi:ferredoxin